MSDEELKTLEGKPYTKENAKKMIYGGRINSKGIIVEVKTSKEICRKKSIIPFF